MIFSEIFVLWNLFIAEQHANWWWLVFFIVSDYSIWASIRKIVGVKK